MLITLCQFSPSLIPDTTKTSLLQPKFAVLTTSALQCQTEMV